MAAGQPHYGGRWLRFLPLMALLLGAVFLLVDLLEGQDAPDEQAAVQQVTLEPSPCAMPLVSDAGTLWSPDGRYLAEVRRVTLGTDQIITAFSVWDVATCTEVQRMFPRGTFFDWSPDGRWLAAGQFALSESQGLCHYLHVWTADGAEEIAYLGPACSGVCSAGQSTGIRPVRWSADSRLLVECFDPGMFGGETSTGFYLYDPGNGEGEFLGQTLQ